jgi:hypothetical protein
MSTVVGIVKNGKVWMGADSYATTSDGERRRIVCNKIFTNGPYLIGYIGSVRTGQVIKPPWFDPPQDVFDFPDAMMEQFGKKGCLAVNQEDQTSILLSNFLIATPLGKLYELLVDFQMNEIKDFTAIGSGSAHALGSLYTSQKWVSQRKRIMTALKVASVYDTSTGPPFTCTEFLEDPT